MADTDIDDWNAELEEEVSAEDISSLVVYSRDWTVETILSQVDKENIDLNPAFQRRNAWNDLKRSKLVESLIIGAPVPEIVLAEDKDKKRSFIVIDGKQRLLAIAGYADPQKYQSWTNPKLRGLKTRTDLNNKKYSDLEFLGTETEDKRQFLNSDMRCTIISNYSSSRVLYDIFYRLNTGSVPLSSQELRQVLNKGNFANYLIKTTNDPLPLHTVLNLSEPDTRLRDAEILLRYIAFSMFGSEYTGNLTPFLDAKMAEINQKWGTLKNTVEEITNEFNKATETLIEALPKKKVGRKYTNGEWESRFNRALFEVQAYYAAMVSRADFLLKKEEFQHAFKALCSSNSDFVESIETSTKTINNYYKRFSIYQEMINSVFGTNIDQVPVPKRVDP